MIQELLAGHATLIAERNSNYSSSINGGGGGPLLQNTHSSSSPSSTTTITTTTTVAAATANSSENQNLRCPRCDSSNTKFCYYNNYNLTQPRHFCKTCRRYWTKGGALRNVPIGGGCRKNKNIGISSSSSSSSASKQTTATKMKTVASEFINGRSGGGGGVGGFELEHVLPPPTQTPILWGSPQNSHLLSLLRSNQNQNQSPNPNMVSQSQSTTSHMTTEPLLMNQRNYDGGVGHVLSSSFWRNNNIQDQNGGVGFFENHQNSGNIQELYQKLSCSTPVFLGNVASSSPSSMSNILEPTNSVAAGGGEFGYWNNPTLTWSDHLPTTNGAYQ